MYIPRWFMHVAIAVAVVSLGWFAGSVLSNRGAGREVAGPSAPVTTRPPTTTPPTTTTTPPAPAEPAAPASGGRASAVGSRSTGASRTVVAGSAARQTAPRGTSGPPPTTAPPAPPSTTTTVPSTVVQPSGSTVPQTASATSGSGNLTVIAQHGAIVVVGNDAQLNANTGPVSQGGILGIDAQDSDFSASSSGAPPQEGSVD